MMFSSAFAKTHQPLLSPVESVLEPFRPGVSVLVLEIPAILKIVEVQWEPFQCHLDIV